MSAWGKGTNDAVTTVNFADIMSEQYAHRLHDKELKRRQQKIQNKAALSNSLLHNGVSTNVSYSEVTAALPNAELAPTDFCSGTNEWESCKDSLLSERTGAESDAVLAQLLQSQYDHEYNEDLRRIEQQQNKQSKITVTLDKFRRNGDMEFLNESQEYEEDESDQSNHDWDRFETFQKKFDAIPKCGFTTDKEGEMITKHDAQICGVRNACKVMSFPPEFSTGDAAGFDMKLSNKVFNQLKMYSQRGLKKNKSNERKDDVPTAEMGVDKPTRLLLFKLINNQILEQINGIISTGKDAVIMHANSDSAYSDTNQHGHDGGALMPASELPKECAIKIFKTTQNEFKTRDRYMQGDHSFEENVSKPSYRVIINKWAEKEMLNLLRMRKIGLNVPDVVILKQHVLVMSFIGDQHNAAPKLKNARLSETELKRAYDEIIDSMYKLYNEAELVHADLSEYNILWHDGKCWFIDVAQSIGSSHPNAFEFLMRDCNNIVNFFTKRGLKNVYTKDELFEYITELNADLQNIEILKRIHARGVTENKATALNQIEDTDALKPIEYPFDLAWAKAQEEKHENLKKQFDNLNLEATNNSTTTNTAVN